MVNIVSGSESLTEVVKMKGCVVAQWKCSQTHREKALSPRRRNHTRWTCMLPRLAETEVQCRSVCLSLLWKKERKKPKEWLKWLFLCYMLFFDIIKQLYNCVS